MVVLILMSDYVSSVASAIQSGIWSCVLCLASFHPLSVCILQNLHVFTPNLPLCLPSYHPLSVYFVKPARFHTQFAPLSCIIPSTQCVYLTNTAHFHTHIAPLSCIIPSTQCVYLTKPARFTPTLPLCLASFHPLSVCILQTLPFSHPIRPSVLRHSIHSVCVSYKHCT